jgi:hypothetical protein
MGITEYPLNDNSEGYYLPATGRGARQPLAVRLFVVSRTQLSLYGTSTSCTDTTGDLRVPEYNVHVIGCHDQGKPPETALRMAAEWHFPDDNLTTNAIYSGASGTTSTITGTFNAKQITLIGARLPSCDDVIAAFPSPTPQPQGDE